MITHGLELHDQLLLLLLGGGELPLGDGQVLPELLASLLLLVDGEQQLANLVVVAVRECSVPIRDHVQEASMTCVRANRLCAWWSFFCLEKKR